MDIQQEKLVCNISVDVNHLSEGIRLGLKQDREQRSEALGRCAWVFCRRVGFPFTFSSAAVSAGRPWQPRRRAWQPRGRAGKPTGSPCGGRQPTCRRGLAGLAAHL